ncbi:DUF3048 domain-containing protein [Anaerosporobacter faecicola]|uniref:DUF3048 domain-containing protein n=1 Tax=Anaerosporobacter faecicola TaxID=2718714 RepID=UPI0014387522|nr:DUF3048 domain-containing protein [Anaerosporobacter faecicola]
MKKYKSMIVILLIAMLCAGCKKKADKQIEEPIVEETVEPEEVTPEPEVEEEEPVVEEENHDGMVLSKLTGDWVPEEVGNRRPYAVMLNNHEIASPQSGTSEASILYEAIVEGGITRLMGIFENFSTDRIGSVRSARHYFVSFADEYDAIFVHYGHTKYALAKIDELGVNNLSGLSGIGTTVFYRDKSIKAPHNAFASYEGIQKGTEKLKYRTEYKEDFENHFTFYKEDTDLTSDIVANKVTLKFSKYTNPYFVYDKEKKVYGRYQFGGKHIDYNTNEQLTFKNIIVQYVKEWNIDKNGYQTMDLGNASGDGYYITNGKAVKITWKKNESSSKMHYYDEEGNILTINPGKTYIAIFPTDRQSDVVLSDKTSE